MDPKSSSQTQQIEELQLGVETARILVVDDMALMRQMIGMCLARGGHKNIIYASDGDEALRMVSEELPDLVVLDLNMPKVSGYEVCRALRKDDRFVDLPILVQSASETPEERVEVFAAGATDFVSKPINQPELLARVRMHLENRFLINSLTEFRESMNSELVMARDMQQSLLPEETVIKEIEKTNNVVIEHFYRACFELGGDLWGCWQLPYDQVGVYVLDIAGHGVGAALNTFRTHASMGRFQRSRVNPAQFMTDLNSVLAPAFPLGQFATMFYAVINYKTGHIKYAGAGAPKPMVIGPNGVRLLDSTGMPVGIVKKPEYVNLEDKLEPGESLFCYSDVLVEAPERDGSMLGEDGLIRWVEELNREGDRHTLVSRLLRRFFDAQPASSLPDDLTAVAIHPRDLGSS
ncbi:MAG: fused response regulator/phosphatase [Kordiimonadaceae bacterium]|nr:fused response regulator/phosphatase [Kordiimonadaceae bacterium]